VNQIDSLYLAEALEELGFSRVSDGKSAEVCIINTCTVTARTDSQCRQMIRRTVRENPDARVIVTGCYAEVDPDAVMAIPGVSRVLGNQAKRSAREILAQDLISVRKGQAREKGATTERLIHGSGGRSRAFVRVQDGCNAVCAYCIVPSARGPVRSEDPDQVIDQVRLLVDLGFSEIVLSGIHLGAYGLDRHEKEGLSNLLRRMIKVPGKFRIRLSSVEPMELSRSLIDLVTEGEKICNHLHIPLQSGDNTILNRMRRPYTAEQFAEIVFRLRAKDPLMGIGTDLIVGLPGETDACFEKTCEWLDKLPLTHFHIFPYSIRPGTDAASMSGQVDDSIKKERAKQARALARRMKSRFLHLHSGRVLQAVSISSPDQPEQVQKVLTGNYLEGVMICASDPAEGIFSVKVSGISDDKLLIKAV
jgi:threonylcarbamoyladenosine tRNA methylthiotransferase MtaB